MSEEKRYYIDPGIGKKKHNCPYSCYEDGRDVKEDILPPKGYVLKGFKHIPQSSDKRYDGKLIAEYEKAPFATRLKQNAAKYVLFALLVVVALIVLSTLGIFSKSTKQETHEQMPVEVKKIDTIVQQDSVATDTLNEPMPVPTETKQAVAETTPTQPVTPEKPSTPSVETPAAKTETETTTVTPEPPVEKTETPVVKTETPVAKTETPVAKTETPVAKTETPSKPVENNVQTAEATATGPAARFSQEFWKLIHKRNFNMDTYTNLYNKYRSSVRGEEIEYLRTTVLRNSAGFRQWKAKLASIPDDELESINSIDALNSKINGINQ